VIEKMVDLVGIEPTTSSMPWNEENTKLLSVKDLNSRLGGTKPAKSALFAPNLRPKINRWVKRLTCGGSAFLYFVFIY